MEDAKKVLSEIKENTTKCSSSRKDEVNAMKSIMNDPEYSVDVYDAEEPTQYYPGREIRKVVSNAISGITKVSHKEADELVKTYEFTKSDAMAMVDFSKEFIHSYLRTGRKLSIGPRESSNVELMWKNIPDRYVRVPGKNAENVFVPAHDGISTSNPCPSWVNNKKK